MVQIAIMGYGVVGSGVCEVINSHSKSLFEHSNHNINIKYILDIREFSDSPFADKFIKDFNIILNDDEIKVVVETMGGLKPAYEYVKSCLSVGKSVVTSNKELIASKGAELLHIAKQNNVNLLFEASVGGGIPILRPIHQCLAANDVQEIAGILNGTTNFILTKMINDNMSFDDALVEAQRLGYAEKNPDADILGYDTCRKVCIMASLAYGKHIYPDNIKPLGINTVTLKDTEYANSFNSVIKLIGRAKRLDNGKLDIAISPMLINKEHLLSSVNDVFNAILVRGDSTGDVIFYGKGAGKLPTASAVVADIIDCLKHITARKYLYWEDSFGEDVIDPQLSETRMYIRLSIKDTIDTISKIKEYFGDISILNIKNQHNNEFAFVMKDTMRVVDIEKQLSILKADGIEVLSMFRIADF